MLKQYYRVEDIEYDEFEPDMVSTIKVGVCESFGDILNFITRTKTNRYNSQSCALSCIMAEAARCESSSH